MRRIKFVKDYFINENLCIEQGTEMMLEERRDYFSIYYIVEKCSYGYGYDLKEEVYEHFKFI